MKKLMNALIGLAFLTIIIRIGFNFIVGGHNITYAINDGDQVFRVHETFTTGYKSTYRYIEDKPNYFFEITTNQPEGPIFIFKLLGNFNYYQRLITDIKYFENNNLKCIYPVLKTKDYNYDVLCSRNDELVHYSTIKGVYPKLDEFVNKLHSDYKYSHPGWDTTTDKAKDIDNITVYQNNIAKNHIVVLWNYTGTKTISYDKIFTASLLLRDNYENKLGVLVGKYYVIPNYDKTYSFNRLITLDVTVNAKKEITLLKEISTDSYFQGVVNNKAYLFDKSNKIQYEIDPVDKTCIQIGDADKGIKYYNGKWTTISVYEAMDNKLFTLEYDIPEVYKQYKYMRLDNVLGDKDGYYYLYIKSNNKIKVYKADKQKLEQLIYLFEVKDISNIRYVDDYLYFIVDDTIYVYHETLGLRPVVKSFELLFNKNNMYDVYSK
ncbi:MAG: hypothetical protein ACOXZS_01905 [Bacilli bacterium]|jgi:hypothetical protein